MLNTKIYKCVLFRIFFIPNILFVFVFLIYYSINILLGPTSNDLEFEISPCNLFQDIGSIIIEGRLPELSSAGRKCGSHSWPVTNQIKKKCCYQQTDNEVIHTR